MTCYIVLIIGSTLLDRNSVYSAHTIIPLFYSYKDAWYMFSLRSWLYIILNICMFVPLGLLVPIEIKKFRNFWKTYLLGFSISLLIELIQLITHRGIFEFDDLFGNTLGTMIGYGLFIIIHNLYSKKIKNKKNYLSNKHVLLYQIPSFFVILLFGSIIGCYYIKDIGNVNCHYLAKYDKDKLNISTNIEFSTTQSKMPVYSCKTFSKQEADNHVFEYFKNTDKETTCNTGIPCDENEYLYDFKGGRLIFECIGGKYKLNFWNETNSFTETSAVTNISDSELIDLLKEHNINIPENATFSISDKGVFVFDINQYLDKNTMYSGFVSGQYHENGVFSFVNNSITQGTLYKTAKVISEKEAYDKICEGKFKYYSSDSLSITVENCDIQYDIDSKGFMQPIYVFKCNINGESEELTIPAIQ